MVCRDLPVKEYDDWDISELLGEVPASDIDDVPELVDEPADAPSDAEPGQTEESGPELDSDDPHAVAQALARLSKTGVVLLQAELGEDVGDEAGVSGQVSAHTYAGGKVSDTPAGLIVATGPQILEDLLIGAVAPEDVKGAVRSTDIEPTILEKMANKAPETQLPPRSPRRFFGGRK